MNTKKRYDFIFSLGAACSCTSMLRMCGLQKASYPFDWLFGSNFSKRIDILLNNFENFFEKNLLEYSYQEVNANCNAYHNTLTDITFNHDFNINKDFDSEFKRNKEKYTRRIKRLYKNIKNAKSILIVYIQTPTTNQGPPPNDNEIISKREKILNRFKNKKIDILYLINEVNSETKIEELNENITKITMDYKDKTEGCPDYSPDCIKLKEIFDNYELITPRKEKIKKKITKFLINFVPSKNKRKELREKYHV